MYGYATTSDPITWSNTNGADFTDTTKYSIDVGEGSNSLIYSNGDTEESIVSMLTIYDLEEEDEGNYTCTVGERQSTTQLTVYVGTSPPITEPPSSITTSDSNIIGMRNGIDVIMMSYTATPFLNLLI